MAGSESSKIGRASETDSSREAINGHPERLDSNKIRAILDIHCVDSQKSEKKFRANLTAHCAAARYASCPHTGWKRSPTLSR
jgi:hypothetical protein